MLADFQVGSDAENFEKRHFQKNLREGIQGEVPPRRFWLNEDGKDGAFIKVHL